MANRIQSDHDIKVLAKVKAELERRRRERLNHTFPEFLKDQSPTMDWDAKHLVAIQDELDRLMNDDIRKLMIFCPPRHGKSNLVTIRFSGFFLEKNQSKRVIIGAYNQLLANHFSRQIRRVVIDRKLPLARDRKSIEEWETEARGILRAIGVGGGITGQGGDLIIIDDPVKSKAEADSVQYRDKVWDWYINDLYTRLEPGGKMVLIMTRWNYDDLAGRILQSDDAPNWTVLSFPALAEDSDLLNRNPGEALWPERYSESSLLHIQNILGNNFLSLYQQRPSIESGNIIDVSKFGSFVEYPDDGQIIQAWDTAFKEKEQNDYSVGLTFLLTKGYVYIIDRVKERMIYPRLKQKVKEFSYKYSPDIILIEDKASGQSLAQDLKASTQLPILSIQITNDKVTRAHSCSSLVDSEKVLLPSNRSWVSDFKENLVQFPNASHDDDVDAFTLGVNYMINRFLNLKPIYPQYDADLYSIDKLDGYDFIDYYFGIYIDVQCFGVFVAKTTLGSYIVIDEVISDSSFESFMLNNVMTIVGQITSPHRVKYSLVNARNDNQWYEVASCNNVEIEDYSEVDWQERVENVNKYLGSLIHGKPKLSVYEENAPQISDGFKGAYAFKRTEERSLGPVSIKPIRNMYSFLHNALQVAMYDADTLSAYDSISEDYNPPKSNEGRNPVTGY